MAHSSTYDEPGIRVLALGLSVHAARLDMNFANAMTGPSRVEVTKKTCSGRVAAHDVLIGNTVVLHAPWRGIDAIIQH